MGPPDHTSLTITGPMQINKRHYNQGEGKKARINCNLRFFIVNADILLIILDF